MIHRVKSSAHLIPPVTPVERSSFQAASDDAGNRATGGKVRSQNQPAKDADGCLEQEQPMPFDRVRLPVRPDQPEASPAATPGAAARLYESHMKAAKRGTKG
jgi:hypothetical protein